MEILKLGKYEYAKINDEKINSIFINDDEIELVKKLSKKGNCCIPVSLYLKTDSFLIEKICYLNDCLDLFAKYEDSSSWMDNLEFRKELNLNYFDDIEMFK